MSGGLFDLSGKVVLATGANSGIGLAFLRGCAKQGADVVVWGRRVEKNADALEELRALGAPRAHAEAVDVADEAAVDNAFAATLAATGRVDCVFANAGYQNRAESFPDMSSQMYHDLLNVNLHGSFYTLRAATRYMRERARPGYMADIEGPAAYLASDASSFHTGDILVVDGGRAVNSQ